jgi:hypothetical protein
MRAQPTGEAIVSELRLNRLSAAAGLASVALVIASGIVLPVTDGPTTGSSAQRVATYIQDHRHAMIIARYLFAAAMVLFLAFAAGLRTRLRADGPADGFASAGLVGAAALTAVLLVGFALLMAVAYHAGHATLDLNTERTLVDIAYATFAISGLPTVLAIGAFSVAIQRTRLVAPWIAVLGYLVALAHVAASVTFSQQGIFGLEGTVAAIVPVLFFVWLAVVSGALMGRKDPG